MKLRHSLLGAAALMALAPMAFAAGHEGQRGRDGQVNIIYWQAPSIMNPYLSGGTKEVEAASLVIEPLARYDDDGNLVPWLVDDVPTVENGGVSADLKSITWKLKEGLVWSDGTPVTSADVGLHLGILHRRRRRLRAVRKVRRRRPASRRSTTRPSWSASASPSRSPTARSSAPRRPIIQKAQFAECMGAKAPECTEANFNPIGTGPFVVTEFQPNDVISLAANENYREAGKPAFATVDLQGRRRCRGGRPRGAGNRRVRLCLEPAAGARSAGPDGGRRQGQDRGRPSAPRSSGSWST